MKLKLFAGAAVILAALLIYFVIPQKENGYKIGFVAGLSGKYSALGTEERNGFQLAIEHINEKGGIQGVPIHVKMLDDGQDAKKVRAAFQTLIAEHYPIIVGPATSSMAKEVIDIIHKNPSLTVISPTVSSSAFSGQDDNFIRFGNPSSDQNMKNLVQHMLKSHPGADHAVMIYDTSNASYSEKWKTRFTDVFQAHNGTVDYLPVDASKPFLSEIERYFSQQKAPSLIAMALNGESVALCAQKLRIMGIKSSFYVGGWALSEELLQKGGKSVEGLIISTPFNALSENPAFLSFKKAYIKRFGSTPGSFATRTYDSVMFIQKALEKDPDLEHFKETFLGIGSISGLQRDIGIDKYGDSLPIDDFLLQVEKGHFVQAQP